jgi:hypothetical protein
MAVSSFATQGSGTNRNAAELARLAYRAMAASFFPTPPHLIPSFRVWHCPAAGPHTSWVIFQPRSDDPVGATPIARRLVWDRDRDLERIELGGRLRPKVEPSVVATESELDGEILSRLMDEAGRLSLPRHRLAQPCLMEQVAEFGLEGFDRELREGARPVVRIEWDKNPPLQLEAMAGWADRVRQWLRQTMP